jgi:hypothetical protein
MSKSDHDPKAHQKHTVKPNTPESQVKKFMRQHRMVACPGFHCVMTQKACRKLKRRAEKVPKMIRIANMSCPCMEYLRLSPCRSCEVGS